MSAVQELKIDQEYIDRMTEKFDYFVSQIKSLLNKDCESSKMQAMSMIMFVINSHELCCITYDDGVKTARRLVELAANGNRRAKDILSRNPHRIYEWDKPSATGNTLDNKIRDLLREINQSIGL